MNMEKYFFILLFCLALITCQNQTKTSGEEKDLFELINYPAWMDTLDCSRFSLDYTPYPCLGLNKKTMKEIDSIYGSAATTHVDTLYNGWENDNHFYSYDDEDFFITKMISNIPVAKITYTERSVMERVLCLYFIEYNMEDVVFYGHLISPLRMRR